MLRQLEIRHFAIINQLSIDFQSGMTVITGETGAGKSLITEALNIACGARSGTSKIQTGASQAILTAVFDLTQTPKIGAWLKDQALLDNEEPWNLILRRCLCRSGRHQSYINGQRTPLHQLRCLGQQLLCYHAQHAQHQFLLADAALSLLDQYLCQANSDSANACKQATAASFHRNQKLQTTIENLKAQQKLADARQELLAYQLAELEALQLELGEVERLEHEQQQLAHAKENLLHAQSALNLCHLEQERSFGSGLLNLLYNISQHIKAIEDPSRIKANIIQLLDQCSVLAQEITQDLRIYCEQITLDPDRLSQVEQKLVRCHDLARKHHCKARALLELHERLRAEQASFVALNQALYEAETDLAAITTQYQEQAAKLSILRTQAAQHLSTEIQSILPELALDHVDFSISVMPTMIGEQFAISEKGSDCVQFWVSTNPGHPAMPLAQVASGGELARLFLAMEVACTSQQPSPLLIFDEVDVGVSGATAEHIGRLLLKLSHKVQMLCVTHQPQVAALGHHHLHLKKMRDATKVRSQAAYLKHQKRIAELARMIGGIKQDQTAISHAKQMLSWCSKASYTEHC